MLAAVLLILASLATLGLVIVAHWWPRLAAPTAPVVQPKGPMHWSYGPGNYPACGASIREWWTIERGTTTCPECQEIEVRIMIQAEVNTR